MASPLSPAKAALQAIRCDSSAQLPAHLRACQLGLEQVTPATLVRVMQRCEYLEVRDERFLVDAAWSIVHRDTAGLSVQERGALASATAGAFRVVAKEGLLNDYHLAASLFGRAVELAPAMQSRAVAECLEATRHFGRLHFSYSEALEQTRARLTHIATPSDDVDAGGGAGNAIAEDAADETRNHDDAGHLAAAVGGELEAQEATEVHHPNLVDLLADACEERLTVLCEEARRINAAIEGWEMAQVASDRAVAAGGGSASAKGGTGDEEGRALVTASDRASSALPRAVVMDGCSIAAALTTFAYVGIRDPELMTLIASQIEALRTVSAAGPAGSSSSPSQRHASSGDVVSTTTAGGLTMKEMVAILEACAIMAPRLTDVLNPESRGHSSEARRGEVALPVLRALTPSLLQLPFHMLGLHQPAIIVSLRGVCERLPAVVEACPELWDKLRTTHVRRSRLRNDASGQSHRRRWTDAEHTKYSMSGTAAEASAASGVPSPRGTGKRLLGRLGAKEYNKELPKEVFSSRRARVNDYQHLPRRMQPYITPALVVSRHKKLMKAVAQRPPQKIAFGVVKKKMGKYYGLGDKKFKHRFKMKRGTT